MSFFFKKDKKGAPSGAPPSTGIPEKQKSGLTQPGLSGLSTNVTSTNGSISSLPPVEQPRSRQSEDPQYGNRPGTSSGPPLAAPAQAPAAANLYPWSQKQLILSANAQSPFPRYGAAVNVVASKDGEIYIMGGLVNGQTVKGDLWIVESGGNLGCYPVRTEADGPGPRVGHASLLVGNAFIVFGGDTKQDENDPLDDTLYLLNTSTKQWSRALPPGNRPAGRYGHTMNIMGSKLYVFGGQVDGHFFNDLVAFDLNQLQNPANQWEELVVDTANDHFQKLAPMGRTNHTMIAWQDKLYLFGGTDGIQWFNDVWTYDVRSNLWSQLDCIGYIPQPREGHSAALVNDVMYIFGGRTQEGDDLGDLAAFRISSRRWYTFQNMGPSPSPRSGHSMTAFDKQIVVLAGEPSSVHRDPGELGLVYILDTAKIRYPNDQQIQQTPAGERVAGNRRPSQDKMNGRAPMNKDALPLQSKQLSRPGGTSMSHIAPGPPPSQQAPTPRQAPNNVNLMNGSGPGSRPPNEGKRPFQNSDHSRGTSFEGRPELSDASRVAGVRSISAASNNRPQPQQVQYGNTHTEYDIPEQVGDTSAAPSGALSKSFSQTHGLRQGNYAALGDDPNDSVAAQNGTFLARDTMVFEDAHAPDGASSKEIDDLKKMNASYLTELAAARRAGYVSGSDQHTSFHGSVISSGEHHQHVPEQLSRIRNVFTGGSTNVPAKFQSLIQHIAELERQRDAAVKDAANSRAMLAASQDSPTTSPNLGSREFEGSEQSGLAKKLATTLAAHKGLQSKLSALEAEHASEKKAREIAESNAEAAHQRALDLDNTRNPVELDGLRAELYQAQKEAREVASQLNEVQSRSKLLEIEHEDLKRQFSDISGNSSDHVNVIGTLRSAVSASDEKYSLLEKQLMAEREAKESIQVKLSQLRTEHEERTSELETTSRKLRDAEELAEKHSNEASKHREVLLAGLDKLNLKSSDNSLSATHEKKMVAMQQQVKDAHALVTKSQADAERASEKLRSAEERIAGLEAYQQQSSREALTLRKQLQDAVRSAQQHQSQHADLRSKLEAHQRDASALGVQHGALKNLMEQRSLSATRSLESPGPDSNRLRELEHMLEESNRAHEETKSGFEMSHQSSEKAYREKLEQLEQDYQSAVSYVRGTEKMLKRMKDELTKSKSHNTRLQTELETAKSGGSVAAPAGWETERSAMQQEIEKMQDSVKAAIGQLESQVAEVREELQAAQKERDDFRSRNDQLNMAVEQARADLETHKRDNAALESRATDAESKITLLLDQMEHSVDHYRRQSQMPSQQPNGAANHVRNTSTSTYDDGHSHSNSIGGDSFSTSGLDRNSMALDNLASELETLRTQWEGTHKTYRLSNNFDFDRRPSENSGNGNGAELSSSLASWRKRLEAEERDKSRVPDATPAALRPAVTKQES